jgi:hypothetical protein
MVNKNGKGIVFPGDSINISYWTDHGPGMVVSDAEVRGSNHHLEEFDKYLYCKKADGTIDGFPWHRFYEDGGIEKFIYTRAAKGTPAKQEPVMDRSSSKMNELIVQAETIINLLDKLVRYHWSTVSTAGGAIVEELNHHVTEIINYHQECLDGKDKEISRLMESIVKLGAKVDRLKKQARDLSAKVDRYTTHCNIYVKPNVVDDPLAEESAVKLILALHPDMKSEDALAMFVEACTMAPRFPLLGLVPVEDFARAMRECRLPKELFDIRFTHALAAEDHIVCVTEGSEEK